MSALAALQELVEECARRLDTSVVVQDSRRRIVAYAVGNPEAVDDVRRASILGRTTPPEIEAWISSQGVYRSRGPVRVRVPDDVSPGYLGRLGIPLRVGESLVGVVWMIDEADEIGDAELASVQPELTQSALWLYEEEMAQRLASELLAQLLSPDADLRDRAALEMLERGHHHDEELVVVVERRVSQDGQTLGGFPSWMGPSREGAMRTSALMLSDHNAYLVPLTPTLDLHELLSRLRLEVNPPSTGKSFGVGHPVTGLDQVEHSYRQALRAMRCAERLPEFRGVATWKELGIFKILPLSPHGAGGEEILDHRIQPLLDSRHANLLETVSVYLDYGGDVKRAAAELNVHRGTLYYRLEKAAELTGYDLSRGFDRLSLHASLLLARLWGYA